MSELKPCPFCGGEAELKTTYDTEYIQCKNCGARTRMVVGDYYDEGFMDGQYAAPVWNRRTQPANEPLTLEQLREMEAPYPLWKEEPPRGDMTESRIEPVLFNGIYSGNEERACWVTGEAHRGNSRIEYIAAGETNFYLRKPEGSENDVS